MSAPAAFQIEARDNVATALADIAPGAVNVTGDASVAALVALEPIPRGHKLANSDIAAGENIVKYGVSIGSATRDIVRGAWIHLHNMQSDYDNGHQ